jgi:peptidoglycan-associated lipoprotein
MKLPSHTLCLVLASAALVFAGCSKKPTRPDPSATLLGPQGGGASTINPTDIATATPGGDLSARDNGFDASGQNRAALAAQTVYFDFDKSSIKASERPKLQAAKDYLDKNPGQRLLLEGHCDWRGTAEYNLALGDRRASAAKKYLQSIGVPVDRVETLSKGSLEASKNADQATMAKDRRVDLVIVQPGAGSALPTAGAASGPASAAGSSLPPATGGL